MAKKFSQIRKLSFVIYFSKRLDGVDSLTKSKERKELARMARAWMGYSIGYTDCDIISGMQRLSYKVGIFMQEIRDIDLGKVLLKEDIKKKEKELEYLKQKLKKLN